MKFNPITDMPCAHRVVSAKYDLLSERLHPILEVPGCEQHISPHLHNKKKSFNRILILGYKLCKYEYKFFLKASLTFFGLSPCLRTCSRTMKKCCRGIWSESSCLPNFKLLSITSFTTSLLMFTRLLLSMRTGSRSGKDIGIQ